MDVPWHESGVIWSLVQSFWNQPMFQYTPHNHPLLTINLWDLARRLLHAPQPTVIVGKPPPRNITGSLGSTHRRRSSSSLVTGHKHVKWIWYGIVGRCDLHRWSPCWHVSTCCTWLCLAKCRYTRHRWKFISRVGGTTQPTHPHNQSKLLFPNGCSSMVVGF